MIPLLSPKPFAEFSPEEFRAYVESLYVEPERAAPPADFSLSINGKGALRLTVRRDPKWLASAEVAQLADEAGLTLQNMWSEVLKRKIEIRVPRKEKK